MDSENAFTLFPNLLQEVPEVPQDGILSRTIFKSERLSVVLFAFDAGQELSEHTSSYPAVLHFIQGEATVTLGEETVTAGAHTWVHMQPHLPHSILAQTPVILLLLMQRV